MQRSQYYYCRKGTAAINTSPIIITRRCKAWLNAISIQPPRSLPGHRQLDMLLRSLHLLALAGVGGGFLFDLPEARWLQFWYLSLATGFGLMLLALYASFLWLLRLKGLVIVFKLLLLWLATLLPAWRAELFALAVLLSSAMAHVPNVWRSFSIWPAANHVESSSRRSNGKCRD